MHIAAILDRAAQLWPGREAVVCGDIRLNYARFAERARALGAALRGAGLDLGDRVAIVHPNDHVFLEAYFAAAHAGLVLVPINTRLTGREVAFILRDSGARLVLAHEDHRPLVEDALAGDLPALPRVIWSTATQLDEEVEPLPDRQPAHRYEAFVHSGRDATTPIRSPGDDELAQLYYTSGTTGRPKGVMLTHRNVVTHTLGAVAELQLTDGDVWAHVAPMFHLADAWATFAITLIGGRHVTVPRFDAAAVLDVFEREQITLTNLIPTMLGRLVDEPSAASRTYAGLRLLLSGGAPIAPELVRRIMDTFRCEYVQTYGMTETSPYLTVSVLKAHLRQLPDDERFRYQARTGRPFLTVELRVVDEYWRDVAADDTEVGEIVVRGDSVTRGYWNRPAETSAAFLDDWLRTGDLATIDDEGYVNIVDRRKDVILTGGENVYSTEVEYALAEHPGVREAAVIGVPDERWGEAVKAVVALREDHEADEASLIAHCKERLASFKVPKSVDFVEELPRTGSGKITKRPLRERYWQDRDRRVH